MQEIVKYIFLFLITSTILNLAIAICARWKTKNSHFNVLIYYWISLFGTYFSAAMLSHNEKQIVFAYFFQVVPSFLIIKMLEDLRGMKSHFKVYSVVWVVCASITTYLNLNTSVGFTLSLVPITFATCLPFFRVIWRTLITDFDSSNWIEKGMALMYISGVVNHWNYAFFRLDENSQWWGWGVSIAQYQCLSVFLPLALNFKRVEAEKKNVQHALDKISGQNSDFNMEIDELYKKLESQISQKEELTNKLQQTNEHLKVEQETNEILIKTISHDLVNPLSVINAYTEMLQTGRIKVEDFHKTLHRISASCNSALMMISRARNAVVSKNQANLIKIQAVSLERSIQRLTESFETKLRAKNLSIAYENPMPPETLVLAEENALVEHVFSNVLTNSIKYSYAGSVIKIIATNRPNHVEVDFIDNGQGIDPRRLEKKVLHSTEGTKGEPGSGFGFIIISYYLRKFGGSYEIQSKGHNQGTTVTIHLQKITTPFCV